MLMPDIGGTLSSAQSSVVVLSIRVTQASLPGVMQLPGASLVLSVPIMTESVFTMLTWVVLKNSASHFFKHLFRHLAVLSVILKRPPGAAIARFFAYFARRATATTNSPPASARWFRLSVTWHDQENQYWWPIVHPTLHVSRTSHRPRISSTDLDSNAAIHSF